MTLSKQKYSLQIPVELYQYTDKDSSSFTITVDSESKNRFPMLRGVIGSGETIEQAEKSFFDGVKTLHQYHLYRSRKLDLIYPFQKGNWSERGGTWFTCFGINVYFRYGKNMRGGWYIPLTKLNIMITNYWKRHVHNNTSK